MSTVLTFPRRPQVAQGIPLRIGCNPQELLCALFSHDIGITSVTVSPDVSVDSLQRALASFGAGIAIRHGYYEVTA